jgi:hypothetical protein
VVGKEIVKGRNCFRFIVEGCGGRLMGLGLLEMMMIGGVGTISLLLIL